MTQPNLDALGGAGSPHESRAFPTITLTQPPATQPRQGAARHLPSIEGSVVADRVYRLALLFFALCVPALLLVIFLEVGRAGWPALHAFGLDFLTTSAWDPVKGQFGAAPAIIGTLLTSLIALILATPLALGAAIGMPDISINARATRCDGTRTATFGRPAVTRSGTSGFFLRISVNGPAQNDSASLRAPGGMPTATWLT